MKELLNTGVNFPLDYDSANDAFVGQVKGYSVAVKENLSTSSYGCLFWIKEGDAAPSEKAEEYLIEKQKAAPDFVKKFMISETGAAVALNRTYDDFANVNNLKRFIFDFTGALSANGYKNCCCECGKTANLSLYTTEGTIAQACSVCGGKYQFLRAVECESEPVVPVIPEEPVVIDGFKQAEIAEEPAAKEEPLFIAPEIVVPDMPVVEKFPEFSVSDTDGGNAEIEEPLTPTEKKNTEENNLLLTPDEENTAEESPAAQKGGVVLQKESDDSTDLSELMFTEIKQEPLSEEHPAAETAVQQAGENFDSLLFTGEEEKKSEPVRSALFEQIEREYAAEQAKLKAETAEDKQEENLNDLLIDDNGQFELKEIEHEIDDGSSDVTEFHDDSNDGEDVEIEEIESTVNVPTVTTGHPQLEAEETPLEKDGSVPLINPNSHREERQVSPVDGPDAVQPLELAASITHEDLGELPEIQLPPGYATGENMERDVPETTAPPPYSPTYDYSSYERIKVRSDNSNIFMGFIGALVMGLIGAAVWMLIAGFLDIASYIGSLAIVLSVYGGYYLAGGALDKKGIIVSFVVSIVFTAIGAVAVLSIDMANSLSEVFHTDATLRDGFNWVVSALSNEETRGTVLFDIVVSMLITLVADISAAVKSWRTA